MRRVAFFIFLFFLSFAVHAAERVLITSMRISPAAAKTIILFDLTQKTTGSVKFIPAEKKLILKFENAALKFNVKNARLGGANVSSFSARELPDKSAEFNFMTTGNVEWNTVYEAQPNGTMRMRFEIISVNAVLKKAEARVLKELASFNQELTGRARWDANQPQVDTMKKQIFTIVIDAGHGGKDAGAVGKSGLREKDVVLSIAKKVAEKLGKNKNIRVVMTRSGDYYVPLRARLNAARRGDADLFIAVHADAYFNNKASGASVYALSQHGATSEASRWLMQQEKYSELDGIKLDHLADRSRMVRSVLIDLAQTATIRDSLHLGNKVLDALDRISALHHTQVEQAPFVVLKSPDIPSILIETGFITNPVEEARLVDPRYQDKLASAITQGVQSYIRKYAH